MRDSPRAVATDDGPRHRRPRRGGGGGGSRRRRRALSMLLLLTDHHHHRAEAFRSVPPSLVARVVPAFARVRRPPSSSSRASSDDDDDDRFSDGDLAEFLRRQRRRDDDADDADAADGGLRSRVRRWLGRRDGDGDDGPPRADAPVRPLNVDGTFAEKDDSDDSDGRDERERARAARQAQQRKRMERKMEVLRAQMERASADDAAFRFFHQKESPTKEEAKKDVVKVDLSDMLRGVPGLDDMFDAPKDDAPPVDEPVKDVDDEEGFYVVRDYENERERLEEERSRFLREEEEMRDRAGLKRSPNKDDDDDNEVAVESTLDVRDVNEEALRTLEELRRKHLGDDLAESEAMRRIRERDATENDDVEKEESPEDRFRRREEEAFARTGASRSFQTKTKDDDDNDDEADPSSSADDPKSVREEWSSKGLDTVERLRRKKLGDAHTEKDTEELLERYRATVEQNKAFPVDRWRDGGDADDDGTTDGPRYDDRVGDDDDDDGRLDDGGDAYASLLKKKATAEDQIYRAVAAKGGGDDEENAEDKRSEWEAFQRKDREMREKRMGMVVDADDYGVMGGTPPPEFLAEEKERENGEEEEMVGENEEATESFLVSDVDEKGDEDDYSADVDDADDVESFYDDEEEDLDSLFEREEEEASVTSQMYRAVAAKEGAEERGTREDFEEFLRKEAEMRREMGMGLSEDEETRRRNTVDLSSVFDDDAEEWKVVDNDARSRSRERDEREDDAVSPPDTPFFSGDYEDDDADEWIRAREKEMRGSVDETADVVSPPNTPFFSGAYDEGNEELEEDYDDDDVFGNVDEEWFRAREARLTEEANTSPEEEADDATTNDSSAKEDVSLQDLAFRPSEYAIDAAELAKLFGGRDAEKYRAPSLDSGALSDSGLEARRADARENTEITVEEVNALADHDPLSRLAARLRPDSSFGAIFRLEGTLVETTEAQLRAWTKVSSEMGLTPPSRDEVRRAQTRRPDDAVGDVFYWSSDPSDGAAIAARHATALREVLADRDAAADNDDGTDLFVVVEGAMDFLRSVRAADVPAAVTSRLDRAQLDAVLRETELDEHFAEDVRVSADDGYRRETQEMLGAALRVGRRPDHCFVVDATPSSSVAAHDVGMRSLAIVGPYDRYDLTNADLTIQRFDELSVINARRLFGDADNDYDEPLSETEDRRPRTEPRTHRGWAMGDR